MTIASAMPPVLTGVRDWISGFDIVLCDLWGVLHDGLVAHAGAADALIRVRAGGGTVVLVGNVSPQIEMPLQMVVTRQLRLQGSCSSAGRYPEAIRLVAEGKVDLSCFVSKVAPLSEGVEWFHRLHEREPGLVKIVLTP
jgi:L-iditol 2-dehydrogenase